MIESRWTALVPEKRVESAQMSVEEEALEDKLR
jgi:hypothetical protein